MNFRVRPGRKRWPGHPASSAGIHVKGDVPPTERHPMYRTENDTPRCEYCGGSDIHTLGCWTLRQPARVKAEIDVDDELQQELLQAVRQIEKLSESIGALLDVTIGEGGVDGAKEWAQLHEDRASAYRKIRDLLST